MEYIIHRDEIINAKEEINELKRLLEEAKERLNKQYKTIREELGQNGYWNGLEYID